MDVNSIGRANSIIETCILLHNYGINYGKNYEQPAEIVVSEAVIAHTDTTAQGHAKRNSIARALGALGVR